MTIIHSKKHLITIKIDDLTFKIKPLTYKERTDVMACIYNQNGTVVENAAKATYLAMRYAVKNIDGAFLPTGEKYQLEFDDNSYLSEDCVDDLLNIERSDKLGIALHNFLKGVPSKLVDPNTGEEVEGVKIVPMETVPKK